MSFKGTEIQLKEVTIQGAEVRMTVVFCAKDGRVHATTNHVLPLTEVPPELKSSAVAFIKQLENWARMAHFGEGSLNDANTPPTGIAETLGSRGNQG